jgi:hypothetical protein
MFNGFLPGSWIFLLLAAWAGLLFGGLIFGKLNPDQTHRMPTWTRMASSFVLVILGWFYFFNPVRHGFNSVSLLIAIGMTFGFVGDLFMAELFPLKNHVLGGIGSFALGHIAYVVALVKYGNESGLNSSTARWGSLVVLWLIGLVCWYWVVFRGQKPSVLHWAALPYTLLLSGTAGLAVGLAIQSAVFIPLAIGAILFLLSDLLLAAQLFNGLHFKMIGDVVWLLYGPGQMLIVCAVGTAIGWTSSG